MSLRGNTTAVTFDPRVYDVCDRIPNKKFLHVTHHFKDTTSIWPSYKSSIILMTGSVTTRWPSVLPHTPGAAELVGYVIPSANLSVNCALCRTPTVSCVCGWMLNLW
jgi:hypothetical protein